MVEDITAILKALSNPHRLRIFRALHGSMGPVHRTVRQVADECCGLALSTVSHHLKELRQAGLIRCERRGQEVICTIAPDALERLQGFIDGFARPSKAKQ